MHFETRYHNITAKAKNEVIFVSLFAGKQYYFDCARELAKQLSSQGVDYDLCEMVADDSEDWINICRKKISFYQHIKNKYDRPFMWLDVDSKIIGQLQNYKYCTADIGAFLRNFKPLEEFDPMMFARLLHPGYLIFSNTRRTSKFLTHLSSRDEIAPQNATDDFVLQEAIKTFEEPLSYQIFSPTDIVSTNEAHNREHAVFQHGDSGNVSSALGTAQQHSAEIMAPARQIKVLREAATSLMKQAKLDDAAVFLKRIRVLDPEDTQSLISLLKIYAKKNSEEKYRKLALEARENENTKSALLRYEADRNFDAGEIDLAFNILSELYTSAKAEDRNFAKSRSYRHSFDKKASLQKISDRDRPHLFWWEQPHPGNFGDILSAYIVENLSGLPPKFSAKPNKIVSTGSIIKFAKPGDVVWGSGASAATQRIEPKATYKAVRGPLTRQMVLNAGAECPEVFGDPGCLTPLILDCSQVPKTHKLGLIKHFTHADTPMKIGPGVREIDIIRSSTSEIEDFLIEMNCCENIISTSLHGLILANAYDIPARLATNSMSGRQIHGDGMKFQDYFLSIGISDFEILDLAPFEEITTDLISECIHNPKKAINISALLDAAPFPVKQKFHDLAILSEPTAAE